MEVKKEEILKHFEEIEKNLKPTRNGYYFIWTVALILIFASWVVVGWSNHQSTFDFIILGILILFSSILFIPFIILILITYGGNYKSSLKQIARIKIFLKNTPIAGEIKKNIFYLHNGNIEYYMNNDFLLSYYNSRLEIKFINLSTMKKLKIQESPSDWNKQFFVNVIHQVENVEVDSYLFLPDVGTISSYKKEVAEIIDLLKTKTNNIEEVKIPYRKILPPRS